MNRRPVEPWNVQQKKNVQTTTVVQTFRPQMCKQPHFVQTWGPQNNVHICIKKKKNTSTTNVQTWRRVRVESWNVQKPQMCKQPHLCKYFALKCANNPHLCKHGALKICVNLYKKYIKNIHQPLMCKHDAVKCANIPQMCKSLFWSRINHICANISPSNVQTTTFVQTLRPQKCKSVKIH